MMRFHFFFRFLVYFVLGGLFTGGMAYFVQGKAFGFDNVPILAIVPAFFVGAISACIISYLVYRSQRTLRIANDLLDKEIGERTGELEETVMQLQAITDNSPNIIVISRLSDGKIVFANPATYTVAGYKPEEIIDRVAPDFYANTDDRAEYVRRLKENGTVTDFDISLKRADGTIFHALLNSSVVELNDVPHIISEIVDVTDRKLAETALRESEEKFRNFYEIVPDVFTITSLDTGLCVDVNDGFCQKFGYSRDEVIGRRFTDLGIWKHPGDRAKWVSLIEKNGVVTNFPTYFCNKDGSSWPGMVSASIIQLYGRPHLLSSTKDVSDIRRSELEAVTAEHEANRVKEQLQEAIEAIPDGFVLYDAEDRLVLCNQKYREIYAGHSELFVIGNKFEDMLRAGVARGDFSEAIGHEEEWILSRVHKHQNPTGEVIEQKLSNGSVLLIAERRTKEGGIVGTRTDITEIKEAEQRAADAQQRLQDAIEAIDDGFVLFDVDERLIISNRKYREYYKDSADLIVPGADFEEILRESAKRGQYTEGVGRVEEWVAERLERFRKTDKVIEQELDDGRWLRISERRMPDGSTVGLRVDITELMETQKQLQKSKENAELANRAKSEFLANMRHELRTPLNAIIGFSDSIRHEIYGPLSNEKYRGYIEDIHSSGNHLLELISDILDVSAIEAGKLKLHEENLNVGNVIKKAVQLVNGRADAGDVRLTGNADDDLPMLCADKRRLMQILLNLLSNAVKFTLRGGEVTLTASLDDTNAQVLTVTDTGVGMDKKEMAKAMSEFGQVDRSLARKQEGTGLGLPLTKGLVELHGGELIIDSRKGRGTTVTVRFPQERTVVS